MQQGFVLTLEPQGTIKHHHQNKPPGTCSVVLLLHVATAPHLPARSYFSIAPQGYKFQSHHFHGALGLKYVTNVVV